MDDWENVRESMKSLESNPEIASQSGFRDVAVGDYWKRKYEEEKRAYEDRLARLGQEEKLRGEKQRFADEQVKQLAAQIQQLEQRMSWEKLLSGERAKIRDLESEGDKRKLQYEAEIKLKEEEMSGLRARMRQVQELYEEEKATRLRVETERKLLEQEYRAFLAQPKGAAASGGEDSGRVRMLEDEKTSLERRILELEKGGTGNPQAEKELAALKEEYSKFRAEANERDKEQLFSVEDIARGFAHKVRNYLGIMSGTLQLSLGNAKLDEETKSQIITVDEAAQEMLKVIEEYLSLTKIPQLDLQPLEISALINGAAELSEPLAKTAGVTIKKDVASGIPALTCDAPSMKEAIRQIIDNAVEASANGMTVNVNAKFDAGSKRVVIEVVDTGKGIGENHFKKVYQPYFTNKKERRGMGLSFAKRTIEHHHGVISFTSVKGKGSTFTVSIPAGGKA